MNNETIISIRDLNYQYPSSKKANHLRDINLEVKRGSFVLITGESGCGKSTLLSCINGLATGFYGGNCTGDILIDGNSILEKSAADIGEIVGTVFQNPRSQFFTTDTDDEVAFGLQNMNLSKEEINKRRRNAFSQYQLEHLSKKSIFELSSGEKQMIAVASIYAMDPEVILLDEPTANLDQDAISQLKLVLKIMKDAGKTVLIVEHRYGYLEDLLDEVIIMRDGVIVDRQLKERLDMSFWQEKIVDFEEAYASEAVSREHTLEINNISYKYHKRDYIINNLSFTARSGEVVGIRGRCGSGKTTLAGILSGLKKPTMGNITWDNRVLSENDRLKKAYYVLQDSDYQLFSDSVRKELHIGNRNRSNVPDNVILEQFGIAEKKDDHPMALSRGQKQRLTIAAGSVCEAEIYIFDEPTSGLDLKNMSVVANMIKRMANQGKIVFLISHDETLIKSCCHKEIDMDCQAG